MHTATDDSDNDNYSSKEDTESHLTMYEYGLYFLSDVVTIDKVFRISNKCHMDMKNLAYLYHIECLAALQQAFNIPQMMLEKTPVNHTQISNRCTMTIDQGEGFDVFATCGIYRHSNKFKIQVVNTIGKWER